MGSFLTRDDYKVELDIFEGPLDLLLYLIRKDELNVHDIPIARITQQYLEYLDLMKMLDLNIAGEFVLMAATLMHIKSRMLLPPSERPEDEDEGVEEDPRLELVRQLLEYKRFKEVAQDLQTLEVEQAATFSRNEEDRSLAAAAERPLAEVSIFDLLAAFSEVFKRAAELPTSEILEDEVKVADKIREVRELLQHTDVVRFLELFRPGSTRMEIVATFLAMLELIRLKAILVFQRRPFGPIELALLQ
jgi:segregation and condensation protein A